MCWCCTRASQTGAELGSAWAGLAGVRRGHTAFDWECITERQECHVGVRNIPWLLLAVPSAGQATHLTSPWYIWIWGKQDLFMHAVSHSAVPWGWWQPSPVLCTGSLSPGAAAPAQPGAELCCARSAQEVTQGGRLAWPTDSTSLLLCSWLFPISPCASLPGCVRALWQHRLRAAGGQGLQVRR